MIPFDQFWVYIFRDNRNDDICPEKPCQHLCIQQSTSHFHGVNAVSLPPSAAISTVSCPSSMLSRSLPAMLSACYLHGFPSVQHAASEALRRLFPRFPVCPSCCLAPLPPIKVSENYLHGFLSAHHAVSHPPSEAFRKLFGPFPVRPACCLAPSQRSSPHSICAVSCPSSMLSRSLPSMLSASYLHGSLAPSQRNSLPSFLHGVSSVQHAVSLPPSEDFGKLTAQFPVRPACCLAPSHKKFSASYFQGFLYWSSMLSRSLPAKFSASKLHNSLSVQHAVSLPSTKNSPQAICTVSYPSSMLSRSPPAKLSASYLGCFLSVQHAASLSPSKDLRKLFAPFPIRPASCFAPSQHSSPRAISMVSYPSSMLSRSFPAELSARFFHGVPSVQHAVSLPPSKAFRKLFARFPVRPACCLALSHHSSPQAISTVSYPSSHCYFGAFILRSKCFAKVSEKIDCGMGDWKIFSTMIKKQSLVPSLEAEYNTPITPLRRHFQRLLREKQEE